MRTIIGGHFVIEYTEPPSGERKYAQNKSMSVVCETAERALTLLREVCSDAVVHVVRRVGTRSTLLVDD